MGRTTSDALCVTGLVAPNTHKDETESWNGTSWTEVNDANVAKRVCGGQTGTTSSALLLGGYTGTAYIRTNEEWNGVNWVEVADMSASGGSGVGGVAADSTSALAFGGYVTGPSASTEEWSGTSNTTKTIDQD